MALTHIGFYTELAHGEPTGGSLREAVSDATYPERNLIAKYLNAGSVLTACPMATRDVLQPEKPRMQGLLFLPDGVYQWPNDLPYFVSRYNVKLPDAFVKHMRDQGFVPPRISRERLLALSDAETEGV